MSILLHGMIRLAEASRLPDQLIRYGIRYLCKKRLKQSVERYDSHEDFVMAMNSSAIAEVPELANEQHYEVPPQFFKLALGPNLKYSACNWEEDATTLGEAEDSSLREVCERAQLEDGQSVLELGCGWGSLSLWMARHYPNSQVTSVSNSADQRKFIEARAEELGLSNLKIITADMNEFEHSGKHDRVVSIEMFEHMKNWQQLLGKVSSWLNEDGRLFLHVFSNANQPYAFETDGPANWMGRLFFSGGIMPSHQLIRHFDEDLEVEQDWVVNGQNYGKTAEAWLENLDQNKKEVMDIFAETYGSQDAHKWMQRWRIFFMSCAELFNFDNGSQWHVSHYRLKKK